MLQCHEIEGATLPFLSKAKYTTTVMACVDWPRTIQYLLQNYDFYRHGIHIASGEPCAMYRRQDIGLGGLIETRLTLRIDGTIEPDK